MAATNLRKENLLLGKIITALKTSADELTTENETLKQQISETNQVSHSAEHENTQLKNLIVELHRKLSSLSSTNTPQTKHCENKSQNSVNHNNHGIAIDTNIHSPATSIQDIVNFLSDTTNQIQKFEHNLKHHLRSGNSSENNVTSANINGNNINNSNSHNNTGKYNYSSTKRDRLDENSYNTDSHVNRTSGTSTNYDMYATSTANSNSTLNNPKRSEFHFTGININTNSNHNNHNDNYKNSPSMKRPNFVPIQIPKITTSNRQSGSTRSNKSQSKQHTSRHAQVGQHFDSNSSRSINSNSNSISISTSRRKRKSNNHLRSNSRLPTLEENNRSIVGGNTRSNNNAPLNSNGTCTTTATTPTEKLNAIINSSKHRDVRMLEEQLVCYQQELHNKQMEKLDILEQNRECIEQLRFIMQENQLLQQQVLTIQNENKQMKNSLILFRAQLIKLKEASNIPNIHSYNSKNIKKSVNFKDTVNNYPQTQTVSTIVNNPDNYNFNLNTPNNTTFPSTNQTLTNSKSNEIATGNQIIDSINDIMSNIQKYHEQAQSSSIINNKNKPKNPKLPSNNSSGKILTPRKSPRIRNNTNSTKSQKTSKFQSPKQRQKQFNHSKSPKKQRSPLIRSPRAMRSPANAKSPCRQQGLRSHVSSKSRLASKSQNQSMLSLKSDGSKKGSVKKLNHNASNISLLSLSDPRFYEQLTRYDISFETIINEVKNMEKQINKNSCLNERVSNLTKEIDTLREQLTKKNQMYQSVQTQNKILLSQYNQLSKSAFQNRNY